MNPIGIRSCYDEGKRVAETLCFDYHRQNGVDIRVIRIFNTYGPRMLMNDGRVVSNFVVRALRNEPITLYGDGSQTRSFCFVTDLIEGLVAKLGLERVRQNLSDLDVVLGNRNAHVQVAGGNHDSLGLDLARGAHQRADHAETDEGQAHHNLVYADGTVTALPLQ